MTKKLPFFPQTIHAFDVTCPFSFAEKSHNSTYRSLLEKDLKNTSEKSSDPFLSWTKKEKRGALIAQEWEDTCSLPL